MTPPATVGTDGPGTKTPHPLNAADAERSKARVADIELGLKLGGLDGPYWRGKAEQRIRALEEDEPLYGLLPHEIEELAALKTLVGRHA